MERHGRAFGHVARRLALLVVLIVGLTVGVGETARANTVTVTGVVTDVTGAPLAGVRVALGGWVVIPPTATQMVTGADGRYELTGTVMAGSDYVMLVAPASRPDLLSETVPFVRNGGSTATLNHRMKLAASMAINVTAGGAPAQAWAYVYRANGALVEYTSTAVNGQVVLPQLPSDTYELHIESRTDGYASEWYPSTPYHSRAQPIVITAGDSRVIDVALEPAASVSGTVYQADGLPLANSMANVRTRLLDPKPGDDFRFLPCGGIGTDLMGQYTVTCLHPNALYVVSRGGSDTASGAYYNGADNPTDATPVAVSAGVTTTGIDLRLGAPHPPIELTQLTPAEFPIGTTTTGVRVTGANFPSSPKAMYMEMEIYADDPAVSFQFTEVVSPSEAIMTVTVGSGSLPWSQPRTVTLGRYTGASSRCETCFRLAPAAPPSPTPPPPTQPPPAAPVQPLVPARLLESRVGERSVDGLFAGLGEQAAGSTVELLVAGRGGVPGDASAVMLNVAAVFPRSAGFATVFPCGEDRPLASTLNFAAGVVVPNAVLAKVGVGGKVCIYTSAATHLIADVTGVV